MSSPFITDALFRDVQSEKIFPDGKTFVDCEPVLPREEISAAYEKQKEKEGFDLKEFVLANFKVPAPETDHYKSDLSKTVEENIENLWPVLTRQPDNQGGTLIPLPYPYIVPGGRFGEIYYWDSYFTMLGLAESGRVDMVENMIKNFSFLIQAVGYIPNGNRTYYIGRSQPPFYSLMIRLLTGLKGKELLKDYLEPLQKEYDFWMKGQKEVSEKNNSSGHVVFMPGGEILNRYWDVNDAPRPEAYLEDVELAHTSADKAAVYRHLRAGAASGWDFSSRWFTDPRKFETIHTADIIPADLNCLLYHHELILAEAYEINGQEKEKLFYLSAADKRKNAIRMYCWDKGHQFYVDYDFTKEQRCEALTLAAVFPLYFGIASAEEASLVKTILEKKFLKTGGLVTTLVDTGQQWDAPNGWAPLQWMAIGGLEKYGFNNLAKTVAERWIQLNKDVFKRTGKLMEKYNVVDTHLEAGGGEYPGQDGFGWTNGVLLALLKKYNSTK